MLRSRGRVRTLSVLPVAMLALLALAATPTEQSSDHQVSLAEARRDFKTKLLRESAEKEAVPDPPEELFQVVHYESPAGKLAAYVSAMPIDRDDRHPAIIWLFGGFSNGIDATAWEDAPPENDQSASAFRKAGIVMMYPSLRGGNDNPGSKEAFYGEVDDVLAAATWLAKQRFVDPKRIYLGGHSTGGTLALLTAECAPADLFRAVFSFGPAEDPATYGDETRPYDLSIEKERQLRAPVRWLQSIRCPTFIFEGTQRPSNLPSVALMSKTPHPADVQFFAVKGATHFTILAPVTKVIAEKILHDSNAAAAKAAKTNITFEPDELNALFAK